ncbi:hypothetical protein M885DRAFT_590994 [Pelagophyceae sp. CCMP2097]|nr:hypothetical protein M885DRAFT_590994 [Pelagophyceae sp. CCMP2097]
MLQEVCMRVAPPRAPGSNRVVCLLSGPLVVQTGRLEGELRELPLLDTENEQQELESALREGCRDTGAEIELQVRFATLEALRSVVTLGARCIHFAGHGHPNFLAFEDLRGGAVALSNEELKRLVGAGACKTRLVVVNSCHSQRAGLAFVEAGVPHVVAVSTTANSDGRVSDKAASAFCRAFYLAVISGRTVREAFEIGSAAAASTTKHKPGRDDMYVLLPFDAPHDECIFADAPRGPASLKVSAATRPSPSNAPPTPTSYLGRGADLACLVDALFRHRLTTIAGAFGSGKSALAAAAVKYVSQRGHFDAVVWVKVSTCGNIIDDVINSLQDVVDLSTFSPKCEKLRAAAAAALAQQQEPAMCAEILLQQAQLHQQHLHQLLPGNRHHALSANARSSSEAGHHLNHAQSAHSLGHGESAPPPLQRAQSAAAALSRPPRLARGRSLNHADDEAILSPGAQSAAAAAAACCTKTLLSDPFIREKRILIILDDFERLLVATPKNTLATRHRCQRALKHLLEAFPMAHVVLTVCKGDGIGGSTSVSEQVIKLKPIANAAAARLLLHRSPELSRRALNPAAARAPKIATEELISRTTKHPALLRLKGNPFALALSATLLNSLFESDEAADFAANAARKAARAKHDRLRATMAGVIGDTAEVDIAAENAIALQSLGHALEPLDRLVFVLDRNAKTHSLEDDVSRLAEEINFVLREGTEYESPGSPSGAARLLEEQCECPGSPLSIPHLQRASSGGAGSGADQSAAASSSALDGYTSSDGTESARETSSCKSCDDDERRMVVHFILDLALLHAAVYPGALLRAEAEAGHGHHGRDHHHH